MNATPSQRGSILIYAMLTMSAMLAISLTLTGLFINKLHAANEARDSTVAIYAADSAVEDCLWEARETSKTGPSHPPMTFLSPDLSAVTYTVTSGAGADVTHNCVTLGSGSFQFRATGEFRGVRRTLEISQ